MSEEGATFRTQLIAHTKAVFARQHRTFFFQIVLINCFARFIRWDHAGAIVSRPFNYVEDVTPLLNFICRLSKTDRAGQGFDTTVQLATEKQVVELEKFKAALPRDSYEYKFTAEMLQHQLLYPINQVRTCVVWHRITANSQDFCS